MGLSFSSVTMRWASFGPTPWARPTWALSSRANGRGELGRRQHVEHAQRRLRPDALDVLQGHEGAALVAGQEPIEPDAGLLAPLRLHVQQGLVAQGRQVTQGAAATAHDIADAANVDQGVLLANLGDQSAQPADHAAVP